MSQVTMRQMLEAGVHFGHQTRYWNPKMEQYIFGARNKIHIVNLEKTLPLFQEAQDVVRRLVANKGTVLFVGTKRQAREIIREEASRAGMPFVDHRWLGGMLTNYKTVKQSIKRLEEKSAILENADESGFNKKEILDMQRDVDYNFGPLRPGQPTPGSHPFEVSLCLNYRWLRNINRMCIGYAFRPDLSSRLTWSGRTFLQKP